MSFLLCLVLCISSLFFKTDFIWHVIAMIQAAWVKCISSQAVTARRHVCFVKITQFILIFPSNLIQFERQSCRNLFICLCLKTIQTAWWGQHRDNCIMDHRSTQNSVCYVHRLLSCFEKHYVVAKQHIFSFSRCLFVSFLLYSPPFPHFLAFRAVISIVSHLWLVIVAPIHHKCPSLHQTKQWVSFTLTQC